jgi:DNA-binding SARP family transcriptional activator
MGGVSVRVLGPIEVVVGGTIIELPSRRQRAVLAALALGADHVVPTARLIDAVWGEEASENVGHTLQQHISALRKQLEPDRQPRAKPRVLITQPPGYLLRVDEIDSSEFERLTEAAGREEAAGRVDAAIAAYDEALGLWRGDALSDLRGDAWFDRVAAGLEERRLQALEARIDLDLLRGRHDDVIAELERLTEAHPFRERFAAQLMLALYRSGRQVDALALYQQVRDRLVEELGLEPSEALRAVERAIISQEPSLQHGYPTAVADLHETFRTGAPLGAALRLPDGQLVVLRDGTTDIGRAPEARVSLTDSRVSRQHARIESDGAGHRVIDLGSTNGTRDNGKPVTERVLEPGDVISLGGVELLVVEDEAG